MHLCSRDWSCVGQHAMAEHDIIYLQYLVVLTSL